jgi:hypothetical protein
MPEPAPAPVEVDLSAQPMAEEIKLAEAAAEQYFAEQGVETAKPDRLRAPDGKFVAATPAEPTATPVVGETPPVATPAAPKIDNVWVEAAKLEGFSDDEIGRFRDEGEVRHHITAKRIGALERAGIDPAAYAQFQQWRQAQSQQYQQGQQAAPPPQGATAQAPPVVDDFKLTLDENEMTPELVKPMRELESYAKKLKESVGAENQQLRKELSELRTWAERSVQATQAVAGEAQAAKDWDDAAKTTPGFVEVLGLPSEVKKLSVTNPNDPKVQNYIAYAAYFRPIYERYASILGENNVALPRVMADAFAASPFARLAQANGSNGKSANTTSAALGPGSVVRAASRRGPSGEPTPAGDNTAAEMQGSLDRITAAWDEAGQNPFIGRGRS